MRDHPDTEPRPSGLGCQQLGCNHDHDHIGRVVRYIRPESHKRHQRTYPLLRCGRWERQPSERRVRLAGSQRVNPFAGNFETRVNKRIAVGRYKVVVGDLFHVAFEAAEISRPHEGGCGMTQQDGGRIGLLVVVQVAPALAPHGKFAVRPT